jgi:hypothetical protein
MKGYVSATKQPRHYDAARRNDDPTSDRQDPDTRRQSSVIRSVEQRRRLRRRATGQAEMEWEEALLEAWGGEMPPHSAAHYRRKAARARQLAEGVTTEAMKERLLEEALHCDHLAAAADRETGSR